MFKLWSETKKESLEELKPNLGLRSWADVQDHEKETIWQFIEYYFFANEGFKTRVLSSYEIHYKFFGNEYERREKSSRIHRTILTLQELYKVKKLTPSYLQYETLNAACTDFYAIYLGGSENEVLELLSIYCQELLSERIDEEPYRKSTVSDEEFVELTDKWRYEEFDKFKNRLNEVFEDFGINVHLTRQGIIPKQEDKITKEIYEPVLSYLADIKWEKVNEHLSDSFKNYRDKKFSESITNTITAVQAYLQILVNGNIGKGDVSQLIREASKKSLIPKDAFSKMIFNNIESVFARERQERGMAHPRIENPTENNARTILNLAMIFIQHIIEA